MPAESGRQERAEGASHELDAPGDFVELATFSRPSEAWLACDALVERGIPAWRIVVGGLIGVVFVAFLPHGVGLLALMVLITAALTWLLLKGFRGPTGPYDHEDPESGGGRWT